MRVHRVFLMLAATALAWTCMAALAQETSPQSLGAPSRRFDFFDDHDGRRIADIRLRMVERERKQLGLEIVISAVGPNVESIPGWTGVRGGNRHTAEQLENILSGRFSFEAKTSADGVTMPLSTQYRGGKRGRIAERNLDAGGRIDFASQTPREYPLALIVTSDVADRGRHTTELWFHGAPRLRIRYDIVDNQPRIVAFETNIPQLATDSSGGNKKEDDLGPLGFPVTEADWKSRDVEGKWVLFKITAGDDDKKAKALVRELDRRKELELLEMIALNQALYDGGIDAAWALAKSDAPQWLRVAAWLHQRAFEHGESETTKILTKHDPPKALAWLLKHTDETLIAKGETRNPRYDSGTNAVQQALAALQKRNVKAGNIGKALPPLQPAEVFRHLDAPDELADFGARKNAEPGKVYLHQVVRAIDCFAKSGRYREPWLGKIERLTRHKNDRVRQSAFLAYSYFADWLPPKNRPVDEFRRVVDNDAEPAFIREAALMAFSYLDHPQVYVHVHELILDTDHPVWPAAISRLYDLGNEFTLENFKRIDTKKLNAKNAAVLENYRTALQSWADDKQQRTSAITLGYVQTRLERAAWAELEMGPLAKSLTAWTRKHFADLPDVALKDHLRRLKNQYEPEHVLPDPQAFRNSVRQLAGDILTARENRK